MDIGSFILYLASVLTALALLWGIIVKLVPVLRDWLARPTLHFRRIENHIKWLFDHWHGPTFILDEGLEVTKANKQVCQILQIDHADLVGRQWPTLTYQEDFKDVADQFDYCVTHHETFEMVYRIRAGETSITVKVVAEPFVTGGKIREFICTCTPLMK